ncbi:MAG: dihydrodipicolinate synthase family protein [Acidisphaera sp.]|nr:dihydrodipicolinate synthase family protein [Acidisphaera sp.]MBV9811725.1 dihydrodipicolinate synthase family protein [Acetobacteraceae bacterium]
MPAATFRGVFVIVPTPFNENLSLDVEGLRAIVRFCLDCGAHGLVAPANASEQPWLSDEERRTVMRTVVSETAGRATVVAGVTAPQKLMAAALAREAEQAGADMLMAMPPNMSRATDAEILDYYSAIDEAGALPIVVQNWVGPGGTPMPARLVAELVRTLPDVRYVKEETEFASSTMTAIAEAAGSALEGMMGGKAGRHLLDEHRRGACGTMPACEVTDAHVALWAALDAGDRPRAREIYKQLLPLLMFETGYGTAVYKEVLRRRGVIRCSAIRQTGGKSLDAHAMADLGEILDDMRPLLSNAYPVAQA